MEESRVRPPVAGKWFRSPTVRRCLFGAAFFVALIAVVVIVVRAATAHSPTPGLRQDGDVTPPTAIETVPPFSIPKVPRCERANTRIVVDIVGTLRDDLQVGQAYSASGGAGITYVAAQLIHEGRQVRDEPGLWAVVAGRLYAVGATSAISSAPETHDARVRMDATEANRVVTCAAGY